RGETVVPRTVRPIVGRALPGHGLERPDRLRRRPFLAAECGTVVHSRRWLALQFRGNLPRMATAALPERDLALVRAARRGVPLHGRARPCFDVSPFSFPGVLRC